MKKIIIISVIVLVVLGVVCGLVWQQKQHTVSDFAVFPCDFRRADTIDVTSSDGSYTLSRRADSWWISAPVNEALDMYAASELERFLFARMFVDDRREVTDDEKSRLQHERPTHVSFSAEGQKLCSLELGRGYKLPTVDAERRWVFMEGSPKAWRTFVPLMDYGELFEQPLAGWRQRILIEITAHEITGLKIWTPAESYQLRHDAPKTKDNPQGWRVSGAERDDQPVSADFEIDARRVATIVELLTPFMVDDWADKLPREEVEKFYFGGRLTIETEDKNHVMLIGPEIDFTKYPEWARHGEGARFVKVEGEDKIGIMTARRLLGILPALDDMRTKHVWNVDSTLFAGIDVIVGDTCLRYAPTAPDVWSGMPCTPAGEAADPSVKPIPIPNSELATFAQALNRLQAVRYATAQERATVPDLASSPAARLLIYENNISTPSHKLHLSDPVDRMYRYAMTFQRGSDGQMMPGPVFVITDSMGQFLLGDLTKPSAQGGF